MPQSPSGTDINPVSQVMSEGSSEPSEALAFDMPQSSAPRSGSSLSRGTPSRPLLGRLPLARLIPQDVHSVLDYANAATVLSGAFSSECPRARAASALIGGSGIGLSAMTDYRLSLAKVVPIEAHEVVDYAFGISAISAPFLFGYYKTAPVTAAIHVASGIGNILASLFTDYRAYRGVGRRRTA